MMKILFATSTINENAGGISSYAIDFIKEYKDEHEFLVISNDKLNEKYVQLIPQQIKISGENLSYKNSLRFLKIVEDFKPELIINSNFPLLSILISFIDNRIKKISVSHFVDGKLAIIAGFNHSHYDTIIALSKEGAKSLRKYYPKIDKAKVKVIYNFFRPIRDKIEKAGKTNPITIVFPGGASLHKNPLLVYKILCGLTKQNSSFKFFWLGNTLLPGSRFFGRKYIASLLKQDKRIIFTGNVTREKAVKIIQNATIFLLPSIKEGCPLTLLEAMSVGTIPIVSDALHASSEIIIHGVNGFVLSSTKTNEYIQLINRIINQPSDYKNIEINSLITYKKYLTADAWKESMNRVLWQVSVKSPKINISFLTLKVYIIELGIRLFVARIKMLFRSLYFFLIFRFIAVSYRVCYSKRKL